MVIRIRVRFALTAGEVHESNRFSVDFTLRKENIRAFTRVTAMANILIYAYVDLNCWLFTKYCSTFFHINLSNKKLLADYVQNDLFRGR